MSKNDNDATAATTKKSKKKIILIAAAVLAVLGGAGGGYVAMSGSSAQAAPTKGIVTPLKDSITVNLADGHYLKLNFAIQQTSDSGTTAVDPAQAVNSALDVYTGKTLAALSTAQGRDTAKAELLAATEKDYNTSGSTVVMGLYYTAFVTQ
ncbi:flagellar basal body-associated FliL family protein [Actinoplanes sp. NPDC020271]|uniref:flagellar basal body-associated FliL family protein n=1 Tax=Actinoplanes sp. NPDC020271 TaxID=3363896 RepID=UPI0037B7D7A3